MVNENVFENEIIKIAGKYDIDPKIIQKFPRGGSTYKFGDRMILKLYFPDNNDFDVERSILEYFVKSNILRVPKVLYSERLDKLNYVIFSKLPGEELITVWNEMPQENREELCFDLGKTIHTMHSLDPERILHLRPLWRDFLASQLDSCIKTHTDFGLRKNWISEINTILGKINWNAEMKRSVHILHTELMRDHIMVTQRNQRWEISGIFDFGDSIFGPEEYEFVSIGCLLTGGDHCLMRAFLEGYGYEPDDQFSMRIMAYLLIHKYSQIEWFLQYVPVAVKAKTLLDLSRIWYGF